MRKSDLKKFITNEKSKVLHEFDEKVSIERNNIANSEKERIGYKESQMEIARLLNSANDEILKLSKLLSNDKEKNEDICKYYGSVFKKLNDIISSISSDDGLFREFDRYDFIDKLECYDYNVLNKRNDIIDNYNNVYNNLCEMTAKSGAEYLVEIGFSRDTIYSIDYNKCTSLIKEIDTSLIKVY
mgnify:CR=1 FL=1